MLAIDAAVLLLFRCLLNADNRRKYLVMNMHYEWRYFILLLISFWHTEAIYRLLSIFSLSKMKKKNPNMNTTASTVSMMGLTTMYYIFCVQISREKWKLNVSLSSVMCLTIFRVFFFSPFSFDFSHCLTASIIPFITWIGARCKLKWERDKSIVAWSWRPFDWMRFSLARKIRRFDAKQYRFRFGSQTQTHNTSKTNTE